MKTLEQLALFAPVHFACPVCPAESGEECLVLRDGEYVVQGMHHASRVVAVIRFRIRQTGR